MFVGIFSRVPGAQSQTFGLCYIGDFLPYNSLRWVSKEIALFSASSKDLSGLQFYCNEIAKEKFSKIDLFDLKKKSQNNPSVSPRNSL